MPPYIIIGDEDRLASLIGFWPYVAAREDSLIATRPIFNSGFFGGAGLCFRFLSSLVAVGIFVFFIFGVVIDFEEDLEPALVGLHPGVNVTGRSGPLDLDVLQTRIPTGDVRLERFTQIAPGEVDICQRPALVHSHAGHLATEWSRMHSFAVSQRSVADQTDRPPAAAL